MSGFPWVMFARYSTNPSTTSSRFNRLRSSKISDVGSVSFRGSGDSMSYTTTTEFSGIADITGPVVGPATGSKAIVAPLRRLLIARPDPVRSDRVGWRAFRSAPNQSLAASTKNPVAQNIRATGFVQVAVFVRGHRVDRDQRRQPSAVRRRFVYPVTSWPDLKSELGKKTDHANQK